MTISHDEHAPRTIRAMSHTVDFGNDDKDCQITAVGRCAIVNTPTPRFLPGADRLLSVVAARSAHSVMRLTAIIAGTLVFAAPAFSGTLSCQDLAKDCGAKSASGREMLCFGYVAGIVDGSPSLCPPSNGTYGQYLDVVKVWLKKNPDKLKLSSSECVLESLAASFPCARE